MFDEYLNLIKYLVEIFLFIFLLFALPIILVYQQPEEEKFTSYECGFNPFNDARGKFEVKFYLIGVLFLIFDIEIVFILPFIINASLINPGGWLAVILFLFLLTIGF